MTDEVNAVARSGAEMTKRMLGLDLLRFTAAFFVMIYHYCYSARWAGIDGAAWNWSIGQYGRFGVDLFFVISGFVIAYSTKDRGVWRFAVSRTVRLVPAFVICSALTLAIRVYGGKVAPIDALPIWLANLTFFPGAFGKPFLDGAYWTLAFEVRFYAFVAIFVALGLWNRWAALICVGWLAISAFNLFDWYNPALIEYGLTSVAPNFAAGVFIHRLTVNRLDPIALVGLVGCLALHARVLQLFQMFTEPGLLMNTGAAAAFILPAACIVLVMWAARVKLRIDERAAALIGASSYTLYLTHNAIGGLAFGWAGNKLPMPITFGIAIVAAVGVSIAIAHWIEPPAQRLLRFTLSGAWAGGRHPADRIAT